jgi:hypothetical protein
MRIRAFLTHKLSEKYKDCQDSFAINLKTHSIAIADGISQSIFPKIWADLLTNNFVSDSNVSYKIEENIDKLRIEWKLRVFKIREDKEKNNDPYLWKLDENLASGKSAGATFLGLRFVEEKWSCNVIGDSCLVEISDKCEIERIISSKAEGEVFDNHPDYLDSNVKSGKGHVRLRGGLLTSGKKLLLVTDALADYLFKKQQEKDFKVVESLLEIKNQSEFENLVNVLRQQGMHNDDTTLVIVENDDKENWDITAQTDLEELIKVEEEQYSNRDKNALPENIFNTQSHPKNSADNSLIEVVESNNIPLIITGSTDKGSSILSSQTNPVDQEIVKKQIMSLLESCNSELLRIQVLVKIINSLYSTHSEKYSSIIKRLRKEANKFPYNTK